MLLDIVREDWKTQVPSYTSFQITEKLKRLKTKLKAAFHLDLENEVHKAEAELFSIHGQLHLYPLDKKSAQQEQDSTAKFRKVKEDYNTFLQQKV